MLICRLLADITAESVDGSLVRIVVIRRFKPPKMTNGNRQMTAMSPKRTIEISTEKT